jgi:two-component system KDP operon response regulator KdpE
MFAVADLKVDLAHRRVHVGGMSAPHSNRIPLLTTLVENAGKVMTHRKLLKEVWGPSHVEHNHYLRIYMAKPAAQARSRPCAAALSADRSGRRLPAC